MRRSSTQKIVSLLLLFSGVMMLPPILVGWIAGDATPLVFGKSALVLVLLALVIGWPVKHSQHDLRLKDGFLLVVAAWLTIGLGGSLPFMLLDYPQFSPVDAIFESMSGLTTTGATILKNIDDLPRGILFYRQQLQWLGGMGIIVLAVAVLPMSRLVRTAMP